MAEILGIVAGATQLLDLSARLVLASSHLYTNLKNVPEDIEALKKNIQDFHDLLWMISGDLDGPLNSHPNSLHVTHRIVSIFNDAMKESEDLAILLERLSIKSSSSAMRLWSSVAGLKERTEIADRGRRIESLKASIQMWYHHQSNTRLRGVEQKLSTIAYSQLAMQSNVSLLTQQSARAIDMNHSLVMKLQSHHHAGTNITELAPQQHRRQTGRNQRCTCTPSATISHVSKWNFQLFLERKTTHSADCSRHTDTTTWTLGLRALSPRIQAMLGLQLGSWSLSMVGKISPHRVVDPSQSPAFVAMKEARNELESFFICSGRHKRRSLARYETTTATTNGLTVMVCRDSPLDLSYQRHIESTCSTLRSRLLQAFASGTASPADRTPDGITVLFCFLYFARDINGYQEALFDLLSSIIEILIPKDIDSNSYLEQLLMPIVGETASTELHQLRLDGVLISHGLDEVSNEFRRVKSFDNVVSIFNKHPCLLENYGQNPIHLAIVQRSESRLRELLDLRKVDLKMDNPPLLSLAIGWPAGLEILLNAGAEPSVAITEAMRQEQLQSIGLLLDHGYPMFSPYQNLLDLAVDYRVSPDVFLLLIERLAKRRQELLQLALDHLPEAVIETSWCNYHLQLRPLLDYNAIDIYDQLKAHRVELSEALWPGPYITIYHSPYVHKSSSLAMKLYKLGFHDIDKSDDHGTTPLIKAIQSCGSDPFADCPRLIQWYLDMGVTLGPSLTHILSQSIYVPMLLSGRIWISKEQRLYGMLEIFRQLIQSSTQINDDCHCWCSAMGCTAVGVVLRKRTRLVEMDSRGRLAVLSRRRWLYFLPRYSSLGLDLDQSCFTEICRLEIFERLGMAHTCCHRLETCPEDDFPITSDEFKEFQEEDQILKEALDLYVEVYLDLLRQNQGTYESFWISWWFSVEHFLSSNRPRNLEEGFYPLYLPGFPKDGRFSEAKDVNGYRPDVAALTSTVHACAALLDSRAIDIFLCQFEEDAFEKSHYQRFFPG